MILPIRSSYSKGLIILKSNEYDTIAYREFQLSWIARDSKKFQRACKYYRFKEKVPLQTKEDIIIHRLQN